jgi:Ethanolamine utilization protein EutJ (predicted chaperonin)
MTMSFHGTRVTADAGVPATVRRMSIICGVSIGTCSMSTTTKSKPAQPIASAVEVAAAISHVPYCGSRAAIACLKRLRGRSMAAPESSLACNAGRRTARQAPALAGSPAPGAPFAAARGP